MSTYSNIVRVVGQCGGCIGKEEHITGTDDRGSKYCTAFVAKQKIMKKKKEFLVQSFVK